MSHTVPLQPPSSKILLTLPPRHPSPVSRQPPRVPLPARRWTTHNPGEGRRRGRRLDFYLWQCAFTSVRLHFGAPSIRGRAKLTRPAHIEPSALAPSHRGTGRPRSSGTDDDLGNLVAEREP